MKRQPLNAKKIPTDSDKVNQVVSSNTKGMEHLTSVLEAVREKLGEKDLEIIKVLEEGNKSLLSEKDKQNKDLSATLDKISKEFSDISLINMKAVQQSFQDLKEVSKSIKESNEKVISELAQNNKEIVETIQQSKNQSYTMKVIRSGDRISEIKVEADN